MAEWQRLGDKGDEVDEAAVDLKNRNIFLLWRIIKETAHFQLLLICPYLG